MCLWRYPVVYSLAVVSAKGDIRQNELIDSTVCYLILPLRLFDASWAGITLPHCGAIEATIVASQILRR